MDVNGVKLTDDHQRVVTGFKKALDILEYDDITKQLMVAKLIIVCHKCEIHKF